MINSKRLARIRTVIIQRLCGILPLSPATQREKENVEYIKRVNKRIENGLRIWIEAKKYRENNIRIEILASELNVARDQLTFYFTSIMKLNFRSWLKKLRIEDAKALLISHPDTPISVIGRIVGIEDKSNFRREFAQEVGCTPQEWRNMRAR